MLLGDGQSPHLLKWARALAPRVELWAASSRGFDAGFDALLPAERRLALQTRPDFEGGNAALLLQLPRLARWLRRLRPDWIHAHYLSSHGTLAWLATRWLGVPGRIVGTAWGSDILVAPGRSTALRWLTRRVLKACALTTSDSRDMALKMQALGAREVVWLPFGLERLPPSPPAQPKQDHLFYANRGLEPIYAPDRVLRVFAALGADWPDARLVVANDGSLRQRLERQVAADAALASRVRFVGRVDAAVQDDWYARARWYISQPASDAVSVSVLEAMAWGCLPLLSDLPANRELVRSGDNGWVADGARLPCAAELQPLLDRAPALAIANHGWIAREAMFAPRVAALVDRLQAIDAAAPRRAGE